MKKLILYIFFTFLFLIPFDTFAYTNYDTYFSFDIPREDFTEQFYSDSSYQQLLDYLSSLSTEYKDLMISYNPVNDTIYLYIFNKNVSYSYLINSYNSYFQLYAPNTNNISNLTVSFYKDNNIEFLNSNAKSKIENCLNNNVCWNSSSTINTIRFGTSSYAPFNNFLYFNNTNSFNNNDSYTLNDYYISYYIYYYTFDLNFYYYNGSSSNDQFYKKIIINNQLLEDGQDFPSYVNLYFNEDNSLLSFNSLQPFLIGGIDKNNISNFKFDLGFNYVSKEYIESIRPYFYYFGRVDNGTYYSYKQLNCSGPSFSYAFDTDNNYVNATYLYNGFTCTDDLTNIDKIYIRTDFNYDTTNNFNTYVYNLTYNVNGGYGKFFNYSTYITPYGYTIYEKFDNFDDSSSILTSTNQDSSTVQYFSNNNNTVFVNVNRDTLKVGQVSYNPLSFGSLYNTNGMIFNYPNNDNINTTLELLFQSDVILSFKTIVDNHDTYTYYDNNNSLTTNTIDNNVIIAFDNSYDTDYYNNIVSNYIDTLRDSIIEFSNLTQQFYDKLPDVFKTFIYVLFIMFCFYFTYLIIKR